MRLSHLVAPAGTILLALLSDEGKVGETAIDALKAMLMIDSDSLLRALMTMSGKLLPSRALYTLNKNIEAASAKEKETSLLVKRAKYLVSYVKELPEQHFFDM